jgi:hypothetical protein
MAKYKDDFKSTLKMFSPAYAMATDGVKGLGDTLLGKALLLNPTTRGMVKDKIPGAGDREKEEAARMAELDAAKKNLLAGRIAQKPMGMAGGGMTSRKRPIDGKATRGKTKGRVC